jgi:hypothetical protein
LRNPVFAVAEYGGGSALLVPEELLVVAIAKSIRSLAFI